jgi:cell wall-associated NlpC family hydrolase
LVFFLNGIELDRNASHQAQQGVTVPLDAEFSHVRKGDLLFFGAPARAGRSERITHVGIYLGDKLFIHSSEMVRINSLDSNSPIADARRIRTLIHAKRVLPNN